MKVSRKSQQKRFVIGTLVIIAALVSLVASSMRSNTLRAVPVHELRAADKTSHSFVGQRLRVVGHIGHEPVRKVPLQTPGGLINIAHFLVKDEAGGQTIDVEYRDALPDTFRAGGPVQVDGLYTAPGVMRADHVLTKCPSKYEEAKGPKAPVARKAPVKTALYPTSKASTQQHTGY
jgi:cytochrome c-type biogenesis protein CcmE